MKALSPIDVTVLTGENESSYDKIYLVANKMYDRHTYDGISMPVMVEEPPIGEPKASMAMLVAAVEMHTLVIARLAGSEYILFITRK